MNNEVREYLNILCKDYPHWIDDYINTKEMQRLDKISISCGTDYSGIYNPEYFYSNLTHSIGVALIIWNFTKDKKQTLAGLFHDISAPVFKHCIDFLNGDAENQESTEERTYEILKNSIEINELLERDNISLEEVCDYKMYSIADNDTPNLSADRLEYTFSSGLTFKRVWSLDVIKRIYENIKVSHNEMGIDELVFDDLFIAEEYIDIISTLWPSWVDDSDRIVMQFLADITKKMIHFGYLNIDDLYTLSEEEVIIKIQTCDNRDIKEEFKNFQNAKEVFKCEGEISNKYSVYTKSKVRYINPYVLNKGRISDLSSKSKMQIEKYLALEKCGWTYYDFSYKSI